MSSVERPNPQPSGVCQPGCLRLSAYLRQLFGLGDSGCYNPNSFLEPSHTPSWHVHGEAIDLTCNWNDSAARVRGNAAFDWAVAHREELNLQQTIFGHRIWDISYGERFYNHDDHENHVHIAVGHAVAQSWTAPTNDLTASTYSEDDEMNADQAKKFESIYDAVVNWLVAIEIDGGYAQRGKVPPRTQQILKAVTSLPGQVSSLASQVSALAAKVDALTPKPDPEP